MEIVPGELQVLDLTKENIEVMNSLWGSHVGNPQWYWKNSCKNVKTSLDLALKMHAMDLKATKFTTAHPLMVRWS